MVTFTDTTSMESTLRSATRSRSKSSRRYRKTGSSKGGRKKNKRKVVHDVFQLCLPFCRDVCMDDEIDHWTKIMDDMSRNIFPQGFKYRDEHLMSQNSTTKLPIRDHSPRTCNNIIQFMKKHGIISDQDQNNAFAYHTNNLYTKRDIASIRKRPSERKIVFMTYAAYLADYYHRISGRSVFCLKDEAFSVIQAAYQTGLIKLKDDIIFRDGVIVNIPKLFYDQNIGFFIADRIVKDGKNIMDVSRVTSSLSAYLKCDSVSLLPGNEKRDYKLWNRWSNHTIDYKDEDDSVSL